MTAETMPDLRLPTWVVAVDGTDYVAETAVCERFHLGVEDHGLFTAEVALTGGGGWGQGLPAYGLDEYDPETKRRHGTAFGCEFVMSLVRVLGSPEQAVGRRVVVFRKDTYGLIQGIATLHDDGSIGKPFFPATLAAKARL